MNFDIVNPKNLKELLAATKSLQKKKFRFAAGCTDLLLELKKIPVDDLTIVNLAGVKDTQLTSIKIDSKSLFIGARVTIQSILYNQKIKNDFPVLFQAAANLASTQIRHVATVGGNICTASPSGDVACALMALEAHCEIINTSGKKRIVSLLDFYTGVRTTVIKKNEILYRIIVPLNKNKAKTLASGFFKIGTRKSMECSVVSLAYHFQINGINAIEHCGIAIGAVAPTIRFTTDACNFISGKSFKDLTDKQKYEFVRKLVSYANPISDIRATAWYRTEVLKNLSNELVN